MADCVVMTSTLVARRSLLRRVLDDPPRVHETESGVWKTDDACYELLASSLPTSGARTLETGLGISTVLLGAWAEQHTCVVPSPEEAELLLAYLSDKGIQAPGLHIEVGYSDEVLPRLEPTTIDAFLIDGGHGFPTPVLDWFYGANRLAQGGILVIDDVQLPPVADYLCAFLDADSRWSRIDGTYKWTAYEKLTEHDLREEWSTQGFLGRPRQPFAMRAKIVANRFLGR